MTQYSPRVTAALAAVDEDAYTLNPDGSLVTQTTATELIGSTLEDLDVRPGMRVMEIGTGSGFSGALLSELVGPTGAVVSVEVVPDLVSRAQDLYKQARRSNITVLAADGRSGAPDSGLFDRVVAWTTPETIPQIWVEHCRPGALVIAPVELAGLVRTHAVVTAEVTDDQDLKGRALAEGGYVEMHGADLNQWMVPPRGVDTLIHDEQGHVWWLAGAWAKEHPQRTEELLSHLARERPGTVRVFEDGEDPMAFRSWLYAAHPGELATLGDPTGFGVGYVDQDSAFVFRPYRPEALSSGGTAEAVAREWVDSWRRAGRPGWEAVRPVLTRESDGWRARAELAPTA